MIIKGKRKYKLDKRLQVLKAGTKVVASVVITDRMLDDLTKIGFSDELEVGETVLPSPKLGPISRYNALGKVIKHKDRPKETAYRQREWHWKQWAGRDRTVSRSKIADVPYERYPRSLDPPPSIELSINQLEDGRKCIVAPVQSVDFDNPEKLVHVINIYLEIFGYCEILSEKLEGYVVDKLKRLNWTILPPGKWPWMKLKKKVDSVIKQTKKQKQIVIEYRLKVISHFEPDFVAIGRAVFSGYLIFGFPQKNIYVLESVYTGNATYIFEKNWEALSKLTKAEILSQRLQKDRIIHRESWKYHISKLLK